MRRPIRKLPQSKRPFFTSKVPKILAVARAGVMRFVDHPHIFPELAWRPGRTKMTYQPFRYALAQDLCVLISSMDLVTMRIGYPIGDPADRRFRPRTNENLANLAGIGLRRWQRAMAVLKASFVGFVRVYPRAELKGGRYIGHAAVRVIPEWLFHRLGMHAELATVRQELGENRRADVARARAGLVNPAPHEPRADAKPTTDFTAEPPAPDTS